MKKKYFRKEGKQARCFLFGNTFPSLTIYLRTPLSKRDEDYKANMKNVERRTTEYRVDREGSYSLQAIKLSILILSINRT